MIISFFSVSFVLALSSWSSGNIGPVVTSAQMVAISSTQFMQPVIPVVWDHNANLSTIQRAELYINWYNASIEYINSVSNGTPADYRLYMPYYPGPPIFDDIVQVSSTLQVNIQPSPQANIQPSPQPNIQPSPQANIQPSPQPTIQPVPIAVSVITVKNSQSTMAPVSKPVITTSATATSCAPVAVQYSPMIVGPYPIPAFNFCSNAILTQLSRMNATLDQLNDAYEQWFDNTANWLSQKYGVLPNGTHIDTMDSVYSTWLNASQSILNNFLTDNPRFSSYLNNQPNKSMASQMLNHLMNPPPTELLTNSSLTNSSSMTGNLNQLQQAYLDWYNEAHKFLQLSSVPTAQELNVSGLGSSDEPSTFQYPNQSMSLAEFNAAYQAWASNNTIGLLTMNENSEASQNASLLPLLNHLISTNPSLQNQLAGNVSMDQLSQAFDQWMNSTSAVLAAMGQSGASGVSSQSLLLLGAPTGNPLAAGSQSSALNVNLGELVDGAIPQLLAASNNGTNAEALQTAYLQWYQKTHASLADYITPKISASQ